MRLLLDTHALLWFIAGSDRLSDHAKDTLADGTHEAFLSVASLWEIAIKVSLGKLTLGAPFEQLIPEQLQQNNFQVLGVELSHLNGLLTLPMHHRDPFDRIIICQAIEENLTLISVDGHFDAYNINPRSRRSGLASPMEEPMDVKRASLALMALSIPALACSRPPRSVEAIHSSDELAQAPTQEPTEREHPAPVHEAPQEYVSMRSPTVFDADIWDAIQASERWPLVDAAARLAPELCRAPRPHRPDPDQGALSQSEDGETHGRKLYRLKVKDQAAYAAMKPGDVAPIGQTLIKDAWIATPDVVDKINGDKINGDKINGDRDIHDTRGAMWAQVGALRYVATAPTSLFIMQKLDPSTEGTDRGWVYAVTTPDRRDIAAAGALKACMGCHARAPHDRLFGLGGAP